MLWTELLTVLEADVLVNDHDFEVGSIAAADLLSDILATRKQEFVILTGQTSAPAIRTALAVGALGVVVVRGKSVPPETIELARNNDVPLAVTELRMFEACYIGGVHLWNSPLSKSSSTD